MTTHYVAISRAKGYDSIVNCTTDPIPGDVNYGQMYGPGDFPAAAFAVNHWMQAPRPRVLVRLAPLQRWIIVSNEDFERYGAACGWEMDRLCCVCQKPGACSHSMEVFQ
jgi:hypothetical protein